MISAAITIVAAALFFPQPASADLMQQGAKLVGNPTGGPAEQGWSIALSADGNTAIVGGKFAYSGIGAAWIYTRSNGVWTQQGGELVAPDAVGNSAQGTSVAISADGNTAVIGGPQDNGGPGAIWIWGRTNGAWTQRTDKLTANGAVGNAHLGSGVAMSADGMTVIAGAEGDNGATGAAFVFQRTNNIWAQQGGKLVGSGSVGVASQGWAVAVSSDGNTALWGGYQDNGMIGAAWVFTRSAGTWTQQGDKLVGTGAVGTAGQGHAVALSGDGTTALVGGYQDNVGVGATWVFTRSNATWTQQGAKLVGTGFGPANTSIYQGFSVALSSNGNTALIGGPFDMQDRGSLWVFTRSGTAWTQQGGKLFGTGGVGNTYQGWSASLSADGKTAVWGGYGDNGTIGAAWVFQAAPSVTAHDFNADGQSDLIWRDQAGNIGLWLMNGATISSSAGFAGNPLSYGVVGQRDFNGDGKTDLLWRGPNGETVIWFFNGLAATGVGINQAWPTSWSVAGTGDFDGDGKGDILWRNTNGDIAIWLMNGATIKQNTTLGNLTTAYSIVAVGDFDGDGKADIMFKDTNAFVAFWLMNGTAVKSAAQYNSSIGTAWSIVGTGDFNGDGKADIVFRDTSSYVAIWIMNGVTIADSIAYGPVGTAWSIVETGDYNHDGKADILFRDTQANLAVWYMNGKTVSSTAYLPDPGLSWSFVGRNAD